MNKIKKIDHLVITTNNIKDCLQFYQMLGFECREAAGRYELYAGNFKINVHLLGQELNPHAHNVQLGCTDICFEVHHVEHYAEMIKEKGIHIELGIVDRTGVKGQMKSIYLRDPDGNLIEFCSYE